jgi:hypothetical protein
MSASAEDECKFDPTDAPAEQPDAPAAQPIDEKALRRARRDAELAAMWAAKNLAPVAAATVEIVPPPRREILAAELATMSPYEHAAALFERLADIAPREVAELLDVLGQCDKRALIRLFGLAPTEVAPEPEPPAEPEPAPAPGPTWVQRGSGYDPNAGLQQHDPPAPQWDDRGYRISPKLPSAFDYAARQQRPKGSHWSR